MLHPSSDLNNNVGKKQHEASGKQEANRTLLAKCFVMDSYLAYSWILKMQVT
jgi:hypothetical protein